MRAIRICIQNIRKWTYNKRIILCICFGLLFTYSYTGGLRLLSESMGMKMSPWLYPFLITFRYMKIVFMAPVIFIFCDAPFMDSNQPYVMLRTKRKVWNTGQILYIIAGSLLYSFILMVATVMLNIGHIRWSPYWGKVLGMAAVNPGKLSEYYTTIKVPAIVVRYYTPLQAMIFAFILMWLSFIFIGLIIYVLNMATKTKLAGVLVAGFFVLLTAFVDGYPIINWFSPISWNSLNNIDVAGMTTFPTITYVLGMYSIMIIVLIVITYIVSARQEVYVQEEV
ncbi:MAG: hypothetical protein Q4F06_08055 [Eubacteriales bacterium]|nr:hypothetical protein [Eubacteriales bacterium]